MRRTVIKFILALALVVGLPLGFFMFRLEMHSRHYQRVEAEVRALGLKRPADVSRDQWQFMIGWTVKDVANSLTSSSYVKSAKLAQFADELHIRCAGKVDIHTIDWIWDRIAEISPKIGKQYDERFRPTVPERLAEAPSTHFSGIEVN
ncbi:MAG TPA: hypothetical protein VG734_12340 [Lacunisphaera sp.]|nr:hypothetical protein [Lacunisphaera sp.]